MKMAHPEAYPAKADYRISAVRLRDELTSGARTILLVLMAASVLVFIIACSNVANLILARTVRREKELGIRAALGASTVALRRTLLAESLLLCVAGAAIGLLIAGRMVTMLSRYASRYSYARWTSRWTGACCGWERDWLWLPPPCWLSFRGCRLREGLRDSLGERWHSCNRNRESEIEAIRGGSDRCLIRAGGLGRSHGENAAFAPGGPDRFRYAPCPGGERSHDARRKNAASRWWISNARRNANP